MIYQACVGLLMPPDPITRHVALHQALSPSDFTFFELLFERFAVLLLGHRSDPTQLLYLLEFRSQRSLRTLNFIFMHVEA